MATERRIAYTNTKGGLNGLCRMFGAPDRDMAVMFVESQGCSVRSIEAVDPETTPRIWGEMDWEYDA